MAGETWLHLASPGGKLRSAAQGMVRVVCGELRGGACPMAGETGCLLARPGDLFMNVLEKY